MKLKKGGEKMCPACGRRMSKRKKHKHYWKCWRNNEGCRGILKADGSFKKGGVTQKNGN